MTQKYKLVNTSDQSISIYTSHSLCVCLCVSLSPSPSVSVCLSVSKRKSNTTKIIFMIQRNKVSTKKRLILRFCFYLKTKQNQCSPTVQVCYVYSSSSLIPVKHYQNLLLFHLSQISKQHEPKELNSFYANTLV